MKKINVLLIVLCGLLQTVFSLAQNTDEPIDNFRVILKHTGKNHLHNPNKAVDNQDTMYVVLAFKIKDSSKVSKINLKLGDKTNGTKKASLTVDPRKANLGLPKGIPYSTQGNTIYITLEAQNEMKSYLASLVSEDKSGKKHKELKVEKD